jgi:DNA repair ATPase RecN
MENHIREILTVLILLLSLAVTVGYFKNRIEVMEERQKMVDEMGSHFARENIMQIRQQLTYHEQRLQTSEAQHSRLQELMGSMNSKLAVIADWVEQQRKA